MRQTKIIAFEGIDGSGKTVQMEKLYNTLMQKGQKVSTISFPVYESFFGNEIGRYLSGADGVLAFEVDNRSMALWFALDRFAALRDYKDGECDILLINRYVLSNAVYQSVRERDLSSPDMLDFVLKLEHEELKIPAPDAYIYLDVNTEEASGNVLKKGHRDYIGDEPDVYEAQAGIQQRARKKYLEYASRLDYILVIPCMDGLRQKPEEEIAALVEDAVLKAGLI